MCCFKPQGLYLLRQQQETHTQSFAQSLPPGPAEEPKRRQTAADFLPTVWEPGPTDGVHLAASAGCGLRTGGSHTS